MPTLGNMQRKWKMYKVQFRDYDVWLDYEDTLYDIQDSAYECIEDAKIKYPICDFRVVLAD